MTVEELIERLSGFPPGTTIYSLRFDKQLEEARFEVLDEIAYLGEDCDEPGVYL